MGIGTFGDGKFNLYVVANFAVSAAEQGEWQRAFERASEILHNASEGQMQFGNIYFCDEGIGLSTADFVLHDHGTPSYSRDAFGTASGVIHLMPYVRRGPLSIIHEMGHNVWNLGDEYSQAYQYYRVDRSNPSPDRRTIPIQDNGRPDNELSAASADALLKFGDLLERQAIIADTSTSIEVVSDFSDLPTNSSSESVTVQIPAECPPNSALGYCIMQFSRESAGHLDAAGVWTPAANPVTEFCTNSNHDPDGDTAQETRHRKSCWETIVDRAEFASLTVPDPADPAAPGGHDAPNLVVLEKQPRLALILDRSGSMATGTKIEGARHGAIYWLEYCAQSDDLLTIIWFDDRIERVLDLTQVGDLPSLNDAIDAIRDIPARGLTSIRDGLQDALAQIQSRPGRSAVQAAVLLTDGIHNSPAGTSASEAIPSFRESGTRIHAVGVGQQHNIDMGTLDTLAVGSGGSSYAVEAEDSFEINAAMISINAEVRGGLVMWAPEDFVPTADAKLDATIDQLQALNEGVRPALEEIMRMLGIETIGGLIHPVGETAGLIKSFPVDIEEGCQRASFTLVFSDPQRLWLYLIDPNGLIVDLSRSDVHRVISIGPHEFAIVDNPKPGRWHMIAIRATKGAQLRFAAMSGGENKKLQVYGGATPVNPARAPVRIHASARFGHELTGLRVTATITTPTGIRREIELHDDKPEEPNSGAYEGFFVPEQQGRHQVQIRIENQGQAELAMPLRRLLDAEGDVLHARSEAPRFLRTIPCYFDSGARAAAKDEEPKQRRLRWSPFRIIIGTLLLLALLAAVAISLL